jgi:hypothetical protein
MSTITGYQQDKEGTWIAKDPEARLVYTMDWTQWLHQGQSIIAVNYTENSRANDANPLVILDEGVQSGVKTYAEIQGGTVNRIYTVTAAITLDDSSIDRRAFRIKIENRSA